MEDILSIVGDFLPVKEVFQISAVNKEWYMSQIPNKKQMLQAIKDEIWKSHILNNFCPCILEAYGLIILPNFKLDRYICAYLNDLEEPPQWIYKYLQ